MLKFFRGFKKWFVESIEHAPVLSDEKLRFQHYSVFLIVGLPTMDALALLENMGLKVKMEGIGTVKSQSISKGNKVKPNQIIVLRT